MGIQTSKQRQELSRLRQSLRRLTREVEQLAHPFMSESPVVRGSLYELKRSCGKAGCRCASGELHARMVLSVKEQGRTRLTVISKENLVEVRSKVDRYRRLRRNRARLGAVHREMLAVMDEIVRLRCEHVLVPAGSGAVKRRRRPREERAGP